METSTVSRSDQTLAIRGVFEDPAVGAQRLVLQSGDKVYEPVEPAEHVYYLVRGQVRLFQSRPVGDRLVGILGPDEWFGVIALARDSRRDLRAVVAAPTMILKANADRFLEVLSRHPLAAVELSRSLARKVISAHEDAAGLVFEDCNERLIKALLRFSASAAAQRVPGGVILRVTHEQLAQAIGVARETVSVALTQLRQQNLVRTGRNQLTFDPAILAQFLRTTKPQACLQDN